MQEAVQAMGRIDSVFANAGTSNEYQSFLDIGGDNYRRVMGINLDGVFWTVREACRHMKARADAGDAGGSIVWSPAWVSRFGTARNEDYGAAKSGVNGIMRGVGGRIRALWHPLQFVAAGMGRLGIDQTAAGKRRVHREGDRPRAHAPLGSPGGTRRYCGVPCEPGQRLPHRRRNTRGWRLRRLLIWLAELTWSDLESFRLEVRDWIARNYPDSMRSALQVDGDDTPWGGPRTRYANPDVKLWLQRMAARGWVTPDWKPEHGGAGLSPDETRVLREELAAAGCRPAVFSFGLMMLSPVLHEFASRRAEASGSCPALRVARPGGARGIPSPARARTWRA